jgi:hypothetical protein
MRGVNGSQGHQAAVPILKMNDGFLRKLIPGVIISWISHIPEFFNSIGQELPFVNS